MSRVHREVTTVTLASGASGNSKLVNCQGAHKVHFAITCDVNHQLTTGNVRMIMSDDRIVTATPGAFLTGGTTSTNTDTNVAGAVITGVDLSSASNHRSVIVRSTREDIGPYASSAIGGVDRVGLALTKAATAGDAVYTIITTVYYE